MVTTTVADEGVTLDFTGTSAQSGGAINSSYSQSLSGVVYAVRCFVDPTIPMNEGCFRPVRFVAPPGTLVNPNAPAACGGRIVTVAGAIEAILRSLGGARPDLATASSGLVHVLTIAGADRSRPWLTMLYEFGGIGARRGSDGPDATGAFFLGGRSSIPQVEPVEAQHPLRVVHTRLRVDSGGAGQQRGGLGVEVALEMLVDVVVSVRGDRMKMPPPGAQGGAPGGAGFARVLRDGSDVAELAPKQWAIPLRAGDVLVIATSGGGGLGPPHQRDAELVVADIDDGRVTPEAARDVYGVVLDHGVVDVAATAARRAELQEATSR